MAHKYQLSEQRKEMVINTVSKYQEVDCNNVVDELVEELANEYDVTLIKENSIKLKDVVKKLRKNFSNQDFCYYFEKSNMKPDGRTCVFSR